MDACVSGWSGCRARKATTTVPIYYSKRTDVHNKHQYITFNFKYSYTQKVTKKLTINK